MQYVLIIFSYLVGAIPFGLVFGKMIGVDVRSSGSGNIGATNVNRLLGKKMGLLTLLADALKAVLPMVLVAWLLKERANVDLWVILAGGAAFLGHLYPVYLKFQGGKGVATALGIFLYLSPLSVLVAALVFILIVSLSGYVSLGSLGAAALLPLLLWLQGESRVCLGLGVFIACLIWVKHRENIGRLWRHEENRLKKKGNTPSVADNLSENDES
jgi:glycerol-3-phosphate acyltransferase PlsY